MPEGPEIRRAADALADAVVGAPLARVWFAFEELLPYAPLLIGQRIEAITPHGKALLTRFDNGLTMYSHNQLYGVWRIAAAGERPRTKRSLRVALETADHAILLYSASDVSLWPTERVHEHPFLARLGPDVLDPELDRDTVLARLSDRRFARRRLAGLLLDQAFLAGLGNYLRAEILWQARIAPTLRPVDLDDAQRIMLADALLDVPRHSYRTRGKRGRGRLQETPFRFRVYGRDNQPCPRCATPIARSELGGRPMFTCPDCQR
ncbi:endonuclease VIII [Oleiagrimonas soli]|uniref:DNA-(apurinic or apyrimidinic site) lyase n=1 Tax=Oleiagrimonas soli TaxID=1543381 RepID=A0A099CUM0_9GAMM|nr:endonuclease VIII [Oleiagrimonas soli]KGI77623.1 endonuclease VIII [Oleiagrimonas soli]MBB6182880.1 endonuclease-8 [Oleiagrimonas soli]